MHPKIEYPQMAGQTSGLSVIAWFGGPRILFGKCVTAWMADPRVALIWRRSFPPYSIRAYAIEVQIFRKGWAFGVVWFSKPNIQDQPRGANTSGKNPTL